MGRRVRGETGQGRVAFSPSRDPPHGEPGKSERGWFVKVSARGSGHWFTYHSTAGGFFSRVLTEARNSDVLCEEGDSVFFMPDWVSNRVFWLQLAIGNGSPFVVLIKWRIVSDHSHLFLFSHWDNKKRDRQINTSVRVSIRAVVFSQSVRETTSVTSYFTFSLWPRGKACWAFWQ